MDTTVILCYESRVEVTGSWIIRPVLFRGRMPRDRGMASYGRDGYGAFCQLKFDCGY